MGSNKWTNNVPHVRSGEPVSAGVTGRSTRALEQRDNYLKERLDASALGKAVFDVDAPVAPDVKEGQPVFWNSKNYRYELALAAVEPDETTGVLVTQPSTECLGILYAKTGAAQGHVVYSGIVKLSALSNAITGAILPGRYYLSSSTPGQLVKQRPPITVAVCYVLGAKETCADDPWVAVNPQMRDFLEDHIHYRFSLVCRPAGTHDPDAAYGDGRHVITDADATEQGWLPADHESFNGKAPPLAVFGYNMAAHPELQRIWPPVPISAVAVLWDKGIDRVGATEVPLGPDGLVIVDTNGIWWMSDCFADVPWPPNLSDFTEGSLSSQSEPECSREEKMRVEVVFLRQVFGNDRSVVTSLAPAEGSPITVQNCDGDPATTGDLKLNLDLAFFIDPEVVDGALAFKELGEGFKFKRGYVVEGLIAGNDSVTLNGSTQRAISEEDARILHQGRVSVTVNLEPTDKELPPQIVRLADAVERLHKDVPYIGFPQAQDSSVRLRINVPPEGLPTSPKLKIRTVLFGLVAATLPPLTMTYRRISTPAAGSPAVALPTTDTALTFDSEVSIGAEQIVTIESAEFTVAAGETILVTIARAADSGYNGEVGIIRWGGVLLGA